MPTQLQIQNLLLSAELQLANLVTANRIQLSVGNNLVSWAQPRRYNRNITALGYQYNIGDYTSTNTLVLYDCLSYLVGIDITVNTIDPNFQIPDTVIVITNPASYTSPIDVPWADFDPATEQPDGGRYIYYNANWAGLNPMISLTSPAETALYLGTDYTLIVSGGISLNPTGNCPFVYDGQIIRATGYTTA